jgi:kumamolisin
VQAATAGLRAAGLLVTGQTAWSITATGSADAAATATGPLSHLARGLSRVVSGIVPTTSGSLPLLQPATTTLTGTDLRRADTPAGVSPTSVKKAAGTTIATVQLASFKSADLAHYAKEHGLPNPIADKQFRRINVDGGPKASDDGNGTDIEVDLDQESILSTAPHADQHAYFAPNSLGGLADAYASVFDDVTGNKHATHPDPHITTLSSSYGQCEAKFAAAGIRMFQPILTSLVAAGVTVFGSSGDEGIYDCGSNLGLQGLSLGLLGARPGVDYPASSPEVVAVGGTTLTATTSKANAGTTWHESAWSCSSPASCMPSSFPVKGSGGGGGGVSGAGYGQGGDNFGGFAAPAYQRDHIKDAPFAGATKRLVPDIAADANPNTGFVVYTSDSQGGSSHHVIVGGTSLAAPTSAAQLDDVLTAAGRRTGVGDIHGALYRAYQQTQNLKVTNGKKVFRDVTQGGNGATASKGGDPSVQAQRGYDTVTGLGGVLWSALIRYLLPHHH